jgi:hypothetical protein
MAENVDGWRPSRAGDKTCAICEATFEDGESVSIISVCTAVEIGENIIYDGTADNSTVPIHTHHLQGAFRDA